MENEEDQTERGSPLDKARQWIYYFIIGIVSFVALVFLPMLGGTVGIDWNVPNTAAGWTVWVVMKVIVAVLNVLIFYSFMQQGRLNMKENENYIKAQQILQKVRVKNVMPRSPAKFQGEQYGRKGVMIFLSTGLATVALGQAALTFNWVDMITYLFTIILGIIFGVLQMKTSEEYWRDEYLRYALMKKDEADRDREEEEKKKREQERARQIATESRENRFIEEFVKESEKAVRIEIKEDLKNAEDRGQGISESGRTSPEE